MRHPDLRGENDPVRKVKTDRLIKILLFLSAAAVGGIGLVFLYFHNPVSTRWLPQCAFYRLTGLHCSGCGTTRALYAALHGDFPAAFRYNLLLFPSLILIGVLLWKPALALRPWVVYPVLILLVLYWILRNIPFYPFLLLAPH